MMLNLVVVLVKDGNIQDRARIFQDCVCDFQVCLSSTIAVYTSSLVVFVDGESETVASEIPTVPGDTESLLQIVYDEESTGDSNDMQEVIPRNPRSRHKNDLFHIFHELPLLKKSPAKPIFLDLLYGLRSSLIHLTIKMLLQCFPVKVSMIMRNIFILIETIGRRE